MVPPKDSWNDLEDGYESSSGSVAVRVQPELFEQSNQRARGKVVEDPDDGNVWAVSVMDSTHHWVATRFRDQRTAWEFAHLLTYLFTDLGFMPAKSTMQDTSLSGEGYSLPTVVEEGSDAETVLRKAMGIEEHHLDRALD